MDWATGGGVSCGGIGAALLRADGARANVTRRPLRRFVGIAFVFRMDGGTDLSGLGIGASRAVGGAVCVAVRDYFIFDFAYTGCVSASDGSAGNYFCAAYYVEHFGVFGVCAGGGVERDISFAESFAAAAKAGRNILEISSAGCFGADESKFGVGGNPGAGGGNNFRIYLGEPVARTLLEWRSEGNYFAADAGLLCDVFISFEADCVAWRACGDVLHV